MERKWEGGHRGRSVREEEVGSRPDLIKFESHCGRILSSLASGPGKQEQEKWLQRDPFRNRLLQ